ncbi:MAG: SLC13 family permease [Planctomycetota bacterium]
MNPEVALVLGVLAAALVAVARTRIPADAVFVGALTLLLVVPVPGEHGLRLGVLSVAEATAGFGNPGVLTIAALFVVVTGLRETGAIDWLTSRLLGRPRSQRGALLRLVLPVGAISAFLNNTPLVAMLIPAVQDWAKRLGVSPSRFLIPLSYAAILGGTCTLIGTSTNLVVAGLVLAEPGMAPLGMFDIAWVGVPVALVCGAFLVLFAPRLLRDRQSSRRGLADPREYTLELRVPAGSSIAGRTIDAAGLRNLPGCFLIEVERGGEILAAVGPEQVLRADDRLLFAGVVESIRDLVQSRGLAVATDQVFKLDSPRWKRRLFEAVVAPSALLAGQTIRSAGFRNRFAGAVIGVARNGERVRGRIGDIRLQGGDLLLVEADRDFEARALSSQAFLLVRSLEGSTPRQHTRAPLSVAVLAGMVLLASLGVYPMFVAALMAAAAMLVLRCCTLADARQSIDWPLLIVIAASLGIGRAVESSGAARLLGEGIVALCGHHPWALLAAIYAATTLLTSIVANAAAVSLMFSIATAAAAPLGLEPMPFVIAVLMGGSACFATPIGYQTNLMVYGPGAYTFGDFLRIGIPVTLIAGLCTVALTPLAYPFHR